VTTASNRQRSHRDEGPAGAAFWVGLTAGAALVLVGVVGLFRNSTATVPANLFVWVFGAGVVHDAVLLPLLLLAGWVTGRVLPVWARTPIRLGLAWTALVTVVFWPAIRGWGVRAANPSLFPLDYVQHLVLTLTVTWGLVLVALVVQYLRHLREASRG